MRENMKNKRKNDNIIPNALIAYTEFRPCGEYHLDVDLKTADSLISDTMAKALVYKRKSIKTWGKKTASVKLGDISRLFGEGARIDINVLKNKGVIPNEAFRLKVIGDGKINKALAVFANSFTEGAVKMIALSGGMAIKVKTVRIRRPYQNDE